MLTQEALRTVLHYNPDTGVFTRLLATATCIKSQEGRQVGNVHSSGYLRVRIHNKLYFLHRLAFLYMTGAFPEQATDHINGIRADNRWTNLRAASLTENNRNICMRRANKSGATGVHWSRQYKHWVAQIKVNSKTTHIGTFKNFEEAVAARKQAEKKYGYHPNHGRVMHSEERAKEIGKTPEQRWPTTIAGCGA